MIDSKYKIYLDMDGVIADWAGYFENIFGVPVEYYDSQHGKEKRKADINQNSPEFYRNMPWTKDGKLLFNFVKEFPSEILSHAPEKETKVGKLQWLKDKNIDMHPNLVDKRLDKAKYASPESILVDDREDNIQDFIDAGGIGILHTNSVDTINKLKQILGVKESHRIYNSILNPEIWDGDTLKPEVLSKLLKISDEFYKETELTAPIEDILLLGSSAGYNWTPSSDLDLHLLIKFDNIDENKELVKKYVDGLKNKWNNAHNIYVNEHPVEVYIQDIDEENKSQSIYSLKNNEWISKPKYEPPVLDKIAIKNKYDGLKNTINNSIETENIEKLKNLVRRLYDMRQSGLVSGGEYSVENIVFKLLRKNGYISKIRDTITTLLDKNLST